MMKRLASNLSLFLVISSISYIILTVLWISYVQPTTLRKNAIYPLGGKGFLNSRLKEADTTQQIDVLFLGSSHAYRGFDTRLFEKNNIKAFNLGSPSQTPIQAEVLVNRYLKKLKPKLVIYEVYPSIFQNDGVESSLDLIANSKLDWRLVKMCFSVNNIKTYNILVYDMVAETLHLNDKFRETKNKSFDKYVSGGYVETSIKSNMSPINNEMRSSFAGKNWEFQTKQWNTFSEILDKLEQQGIQVLLIQAPVTQEAYSLYKNNDDIDEMFQEVGTYYNLNRIISLDDEKDFMDYHHLNQNGVIKMNEEVLAIIKQEKYLQQRK